MRVPRDRQDLIAVDDVARLVGEDHAIRVAVQRDADRGARSAHLLGHRLRCNAPQAKLMLRPSGHTFDLVDRARPVAEHLGAT
jgi:hypothetical protein